MSVCLYVVYLFLCMSECVCVMLVLTMVLCTSTIANAMNVHSGFVFYLLTLDSDERPKPPCSCN